MKYVLVVVLTLAIAGGAWYVATRGRGGEAPAGAVGGFGAFGGQEVPVVTVEPVRRERFSETIEGIGTAQANECGTVTAKVTDTVSAVLFDDGDYVEAGQILVQLTNREDEALLAEAQANLEDARSQLRRIEELRSEEHTSELQSRENLVCRLLLEKKKK